MKYTVRSGTVTSGTDVLGRREHVTQILVVHLDDMLTPSQQYALDGVMSRLHSYTCVEEVSDSALHLLRTLRYPGKPEVILSITTPRDVDRVAEKVATWLHTGCC